MKAFRVALQGCDKPIEDPTLYVNTLGAQANLSGIQKYGVPQTVYRLVKFAISEHDCGILAPEFKRDRLHRGSNRLHDFRAGSRFTGECNCVHIRMARQKFSCRPWPRAMNHVIDSLRNSSVMH